jgi:hypothetical protein
MDYGQILDNILPGLRNLFDAPNVQPDPFEDLFPFPLKVFL